MRVLVTGSAGQLGSDVADRLSAAGDEVTGVDRSQLDIVVSEDVELLVAQVQPDVVINCAAFTAVDRCETEVDLAYDVNHYGVRVLAEACGRSGSHLVHVSTDYVFDGTLKRPYQEDDATSPQSVYGRSKLKGERAATEILGDACTIVRTSWVCGEQGNNMVKLVRRLAASGKPMSFVDDQRGCPTFTADLAPALRTLALDRPGGIFHLTNAGPVSWYAFVREILAVSGDDPHLVTPIATSELDPPRPAPRPANSVLANARWVAEGRLPLRDFRAPLAELVARL